MCGYQAEGKNRRLEDFDELLNKLSGAWQGGDGLEYQIKIREEWDERSEQIAELIRHGNAKRLNKDTLDRGKRARGDRDDC